MQIGVKILIGVSVLTAGILGWSSITKKGKSHKIYTHHVYYYYPKVNIYYDSSETKYIIWDTATNAWKKTTKLPVLLEDMGKNTRIGPHPQPVWKDNQKHRLIYSVSLYSSPNDWKKEKNNGNERKKSIAKRKPRIEEKKSGIRKFFEDLFSSKKK